MKKRIISLVWPLAFALSLAVPVIAKKLMQAKIPVTLTVIEKFSHILQLELRRGYAIPL